MTQLQIFLPILTGIALLIGAAIWYPVIGAAAIVAILLTPVLLVLWSVAGAIAEELKK